MQVFIAFFTNTVRIRLITTVFRDLTMKYLTKEQSEHSMSKLMELSDRLGGQAALARELGVSKVTISDIKKAGIIPPHRVIGFEGQKKGIIDVAKAKGVNITLNDLRPDIWRKWHNYEEPFFS